MHYYLWHFKQCLLISIFFFWILIYKNILIELISWYKLNNGLIINTKMTSNKNIFKYFLIQ